MCKMGAPLSRPIADEHIGCSVTFFFATIHLRGAAVRPNSNKNLHYTL
jgi:hypothetical protein